MPKKNMWNRKQWKDLSPAARASIIASVIVQIGLLIGALADLRRRPASQVRGPKPLWVALSFINFVGPISYFAFGRKSSPSLLTSGG